MPKPAVSKRQPNSKINIPEGLWTKCSACGEIIYEKELVRNFNVCPKCDFHHHLSASKRVEFLADSGSFKETNTELASADPLKFKAAKSYKTSLKEATFATQLKEAVVTGQAAIDGKKVSLAVMDFKFIGGSMGSVVGEKITRAIELAIKEEISFIAITASGGARMQEGMLSLMQMAKTSLAIAQLNEKGLPYIAVLTHPTTGGVTASFATLADVIIAEPKSLIGFTGPRVIERTIKEKLPEGFQTAEFLLQHGLIDLIVPRLEQKEIIGRLLGFFGY